MPIPTTPAELDEVRRILHTVAPMFTLTKREFFAGLAMGAMMSDSNLWGEFKEDYAANAVEYADELIAALSSTKPVEMWGLWSMSGDKPHWLPAMDCCPNVLAYFSESDAIKGMEHQLSLWDDEGEPMRLIPRKFSDGDGPVVQIADTDTQPQ